MSLDNRRILTGENRMILFDIEAKRYGVASEMPEHSKRFEPLAKLADPHLNWREGVTRRSNPGRSDRNLETETRQ